MKRLMILMKRLMILVMLLVSTGGYSQTGTFKAYTGGTQVSTETVDLVVPQQDLNAGTVDTAQLVDLSVTAEKIAAGAVGTAAVETGYELLTTAEYIRSQNPPGSSTVNFLTQDLSSSGFTKLGEASTGVKMKVLTDGSGAAAGAYVVLPHGLTSSKIVGFSCLVWVDANSGYPPSYLAGLNVRYFASFGTTNIEVYIPGADAASVANKPVTVVVWYVE